eukprot:1015598-Pelagomonas_calceolata.AAC.1
MRLYLKCRAYNEAYPRKLQEYKRVQGANNQPALKTSDCWQVHKKYNAHKLTQILFPWSAHQGNTRARSRQKSVDEKTHGEQNFEVGGKRSQKVE